MLRPHDKLLLAGMSRILHLGGDALLVVSIVSPLDTFGGREHVDTFELHIVAVHARGCDLAIVKRI